MNIYTVQRMVHGDSTLVAVVDGQDGLNAAKESAAFDYLFYIDQWEEVQATADTLTWEDESGNFLRAMEEAGSSLVGDPRSLHVTGTWRAEISYDGDEFTYIVDLWQKRP